MPFQITNTRIDKLPVEAVVQFKQKRFYTGARSNVPRKKAPTIWNVYPVYTGDHMSLQGGLLHKRNIRPFYLDMLSMIASAN